MEKIAYQGWSHCVRLANDEMELVVTTEVGPRIIRCGFIGDAPDRAGDNELASIRINWAKSATTNGVAMATGHAEEQDEMWRRANERTCG